MFTEYYGETIARVGREVNQNSATVLMGLGYFFVLWQGVATRQRFYGWRRFRRDHARIGPPEDLPAQTSTHYQASY